MIDHLPTDILHRKHMIILHVKMITAIVFWNAAFSVMRGIYIDFMFKNMCGWISHIVVRIQIPALPHFFHFLCLLCHTDDIPDKRFGLIVAVK
uniref:hypothetical protein n=1 Tax=Sphingobacterium thalpophilum TaxID=259 RepID=UPI0039822285